MAPIYVSPVPNLLSEKTEAIILQSDFEAVESYNAFILWIASKTLGHSDESPFSPK